MPKITNWKINKSINHVKWRGQYEKILYHDSQGIFMTHIKKQFIKMKPNTQTVLL